MSSVRVKICGLTRREDALLAVELGADALGFVFAASSRRLVTPERVAAIVAELPPYVTTVGVFRDQPVEWVRQVMDRCGLDRAQLHGGEDVEYMRRLQRRCYKGVGLVRREDVEGLAAYPSGSTFLLDAVKGGQSGGTGEVFDWSWAVAAKRFGRIILAGGLTAANVGEAVRTVGPWGVDGATGTEREAGIKDPEKLAAFLEEVRRAAAATSGGNAP